MTQEKVVELEPQKWLSPLRRGEDVWRPALERPSRAGWRVGEASDAAHHHNCRNSCANKYLSCLNSIETILKKINES